MNEETTNHIIRNRIRTPDGTVLNSLTTHDYRTHIDKNDGKEYMIDGGNAYLRRNLGDYVELSVYSDDPHEEVREALTWGTYGPKGDQPIEFKILKDLSTDHINNIIRDCNHIPVWMADIFKEELKYRENHEAV